MCLYNVCVCVCEKRDEQLVRAHNIITKCNKGNDHFCHFGWPKMLKITILDMYHDNPDKKTPNPEFRDALI